MSHTIGQDQQDQQQSSRLSQAKQESKPRDNTSVPNIVLSDADYEFLFNQLLEGIAHGWHDRRITKFFEQLGDRGKQEDWIAWLERIGPKLLKLPVQSQHQLGMLMTRLGELTRSTVEISQIGTVSYLWGRKLLLGEKPVAIWEYVGPDLSPQSSPTVESSERSPSTTPNSLDKEAVDVPPQTEIEDLEAPSSAPDTVTPPASSDSTFERDRHSEDFSNFSVSEQELQTHPDEKAKQPQASQTSELPLAATERELREIARRRELSSEDPTESLWDDDPEAIDMQQVMHLIQEDRDLARQISQKLNLPTLHKTTTSSDEESHVELIESWFNLGLKQVSAGELEQAIASWEKALNINPNLSEAWHNRGSALGRLGNYEAAIDSFQNALSINPNNYQAWNERAHAFYQLHNWTEAVASWSNALKIMPGNHLFWYNQGCALEQLEKWSEAIASYEKALEIKPDFQPGRSRYINLVADNSRSN